jgi:hypothetical protein
MIVSHIWQTISYTVYYERGEILSKFRVNVHAFYLFFLLGNKSIINSNEDASPPHFFYLFESESEEKSFYVCFPKFDAINQDTLNVSKISHFYCFH